MKVLVLSALAQDTGSWLRARSLARALAPHADVRFARAPVRSLPWLLEVVLSAPRYVILALTADADCILGVKPFPNVALALLAAKWLRGRRVVVDVDDMDDGWFPGWRGRLVRLVQRPVPRRCDLVTYHNANLRELLTEDFAVEPDRCVRVLQGVDLDVFHEREGPMEEGTLLYVGHLNVASELRWILEAVRRVQARRSAPLTVVGGGPLLAELRSLAERLGVSARFTGQLPTTGVADEVARADVCLVYYAPTEVNRHRSSMKLRECLAMGKKVVCNGFDEQATFSEVAYVCTDDPDDFAAAVERALVGGDGREREAARFVRKRYDWRVLGSDLAERLRRLAEPRE